jgi:tetratricopeptide (TPR) repeat protein
LLDLLVKDFPEPSELAAAHQQRAHCIAALGRPAEALEVLRQALEAERSRPGILVNAYLEFAELVLSLGRSECYAEALQIIEKRIGPEIFPVGQYRGCAAAAFLCEELEFHERARTYAVDALAAAAKTLSPFRFHQKVGVVERTDPDVQARLWRLAGRTPA